MDSSGLKVALPGATKAVLEEISAKCCLDVLITDHGQGSFGLLGEPYEVQALITEARGITNGIAQTYGSIALAPEALLP